MTETGDERREYAPDDTSPTLPFGDFEIEIETLPDGRQIHYYRWPTDEPQTADV